MPTTDPAYFQAIPWCAALLSDPEYVVAPSRFGKPMKGARGEFFTRTLATDNVITAFVYQTRRHGLSGNTTSSAQSDVSPSPAVSEVRAFLSTASGVNGHPGIAHGGFVAAVIDEVMGFLINSNRATTETAGPPHEKGSKSTEPQRHLVPMTAPGHSVMTAELTTKYRRPVPSGEAVLVRTWVEKVEGRKIFVRATIEGEERQILSEGVGLFVALKPGVKGPEIGKRVARI
ncbi:hypothetical protein H2200_012490 [Cladophialophora chaetospira]|uniref:Thioesterase domain-containing protein n=1 Tax=Cladophialophora chaetospira TaxID=386627 RepID=A0AA38WXY9_9EURO|nr:hypothetical protein H2200_012490 [Cladophialophora chaetospira]